VCEGDVFVCKHFTGDHADEEYGEWPKTNEPTWG
jgi:hypothetical protein